jgi:predicted metal-dependent phosphoesterase TrpH
LGDFSINKELVMAGNVNYTCDLHLHTTASDGGYPVEELVDRSCRLGMQAIAITDHDTTASVERGMLSGTESGLRVIPGIELTTSNRFHILGYFIDHRAPGLSSYLSGLRERSWAFMVELLGRLREERGLAVTDQELAARTGEGIPNMSHLLDVMYNRGDISDVAFDSRQSLKIFGDPDFMVRFFWEFARTKPFINAVEAVEMIRAAGGAPVWAHPLLAEENEVRKLQEAGLMGLEVNTPKHDRDIREHLLGLCRKLDLIPTGGTDYHGRYFDSIEQGRNIGCFGVEPEIVDRLAECSQDSTKGRQAN